MDLKQKKRQKALNKEFALLQKQEQKLEQAALSAKPAQWKTELEQKIPKGVYTGLEAAFCKGFSLVFKQGRVVIEKGYNKEGIKEDHAVLDFAVQLKGGRKELKQLRKTAARANLWNLAVTTAEGVGLGALGIGMPDIVLFLSTLLKGIYETALYYGFPYESKAEQLLILQMMAAALSTGEDWQRLNEQVDGALQMCGRMQIPEEEFQKQLEETSRVFAVDMLLLKFLQGIPLVGIIGGAANPVYYSKVLKYVQLKYRKRYLLKKKQEQE